jgi:ATP-dependent RNA helicase DeaD
VWFRVNVGRNANADPRWLVPLICRRGRVTKSQIGRIEIFDRETRFEVARDIADRVASAVRRPDRKDAAIRIERIDGRGPGDAKRARRGEQRRT